MRYRLVATYRGVPSHAGLVPDGNEVTLFSPGPPPEELGFTAAAGHWRKQVEVTDLQALWRSRLVGEYRGEPCLVLDDLGRRLHIVCLGRDAVRARQLGYWEIDREVFEVVVARQEVAGLTEERMEFPLTAAMFPSSRQVAPAGVDPLAGADPLSGVFRPANAFRPGSTEPEPDTLIYARLGPRGRVAPRVMTEPMGPRTRMEPTGARPPAAANPPAAAGPPAEHAGFPDADHGPRTPHRMAAWHGSPAPGPWSEPWSGREQRSEPWPEPRTDSAPRTEPEAAPAPGRRTARKVRVSPQSVFAELLDLACIPDAAYAVDAEVPGAMCVVKADGGFEVFSCTEDTRLEVHFFED